MIKRLTFCLICGLFFLPVLLSASEKESESTTNTKPVSVAPQVSPPMPKASPSVGVNNVSSGDLAALQSFLAPSKMPPETITLTVGEKRKIQAPFEVQSFNSDSSCVDFGPVSGRIFELNGISPGGATVTVSLLSLKKEYHVTVTNALGTIYKELNIELGDFPEISIELTENMLILRGEVTNPSHWESFKKIIDRYDSQCRNHVKFRASSELFTSLKKDIETAGFPLVEKAVPEKPGTISLAFSAGTLKISGYLLSTADIQTINRLLSSCKWLDPEWNGGSLRIQNSLTVSDAQIDVGIVVVGITRTQMEKLGNASADGKIFSWNVAAWFRELAGKSQGGHFTSASSHGENLYLNMDLKGSLVMFGNNGISDFRDAGHVTITNNTEEASTFDNGGTLNVKIYTQDVADLKEIDFGFKFSIKGGFVRKDLISLSIDIDRSLAPVKQDDDFLQRKSKTKTKLLCERGKTAVIAGQIERTSIKSGPKGYAFLRHVPVLNWFFSSQDEQGEDVQLLFLVYPDLSSGMISSVAKPSAETVPIGLRTIQSVDEDSRKARQKEERNWFLKMFTW